MIKLSIILPAYNVEQYLAKCIDSCLNQDLAKDNYEIIVVIDGSPDNSLAIAQSYASQNKNLKIIIQDNQGLSMARNNGLRQALGDYVWFVDSDDWIEPGCLQRISHKLTDNIDILQLQYRYVYDDVTLNHDARFTLIDGVKNGREIILNGRLPAPAPFSVYRKEFLQTNNLEFKRGIYHEDSEFKPRATYLAQRIASDTEVSYNYLQRTSGSITSNFRLKNGVDMLYVMNSLMDFADDQRMDKVCRKAFNNNIGLDMNTLLLGYRQLSDSDKALLKNELFKQKRLFKAMMNSNNLKYKLEGLAFYLSVRLGLKLHLMIR